MIVPPVDTLAYVPYQRASHRIGRTCPPRLRTFRIQRASVLEDAAQIIGRTKIRASPGQNRHGDKSSVPAARNVKFQIPQTRSVISAPISAFSASIRPQKDQSTLLYPVLAWKSWLYPNR
jgi:hypothetical protein